MKGNFNEAEEGHNDAKWNMGKSQSRNKAERNGGQKK